MASKIVSHVVAPGGITCHAWNKDRTMVAICPNSSSVHIYKTDVTSEKGKWELLHDLQEHDQVVTGIDWAPESNKIVTASQDRNAYVWELTTNEAGKEEWKPSLVILRVTRGATAVKWTKDEKKFAVGSGARQVPVCYYDDMNNWWVSKLIKKHKSTILDLDWHPTAPLIATASSDFKCRLFGAFVKGIDKKDTIQNSPWKDEKGKVGFGDVMHEFTCAGWVHSVQWSPSGSTLAFAGHDASVSFVTVKGPDSTVQTVKMPCLPFRSVAFLSDTMMVGAGFELNPRVFEASGDQWEMKGKLDKKKEAAAVEQSAAKAAFAVFQNQAKRGQNTGTSADKLDTKHQNCISAIVPYAVSADGSQVSSFTSTGLDGNLVWWDLASLDQLIQGLTI